MCWVAAVTTFKFLLVKEKCQDLVHNAEECKVEALDKCIFLKEIASLAELKTLTLLDLMICEITVHLHVKTDEDSCDHDINHHIH